MGVMETNERWHEVSMCSAGKRIAAAYAAGVSCGTEVIRLSRGRPLLTLLRLQSGSESFSGNEDVVPTIEERHA